MNYCETQKTHECLTYLWKCNCEARGMPHRHEKIKPQTAMAVHY